MTKSQYTEPTLLEIFYDLYFAATYVVYSETLQVTDEPKFKASVGYFWFVEKAVYFKVATGLMDQMRYPELTANTGLQFAMADVVRSGLVRCAICYRFNFWLAKGSTFSSRPNRALF